MRFSTMRVRWKVLIVFLVFGATLLGCKTPMSAYMKKRSIHPQGAFAGARVDAEASEIDWGPESFGQQVSLPEVQALRADLADGLQSLIGPAKPDGSPLRFKLTVLKDRVVPAFIVVPCALVLVSPGCPAGVNSAVVELKVQIGPDVYSARGKGAVLYSPTLYNNQCVNSLGSAAVAKAMVDAMKQIARKISKRGLE